MPLQCDICEGIRIVPMLLDVPTLRRNKFRDPRFKATKRAQSRKRAAHNPRHDIGRAALRRRLDIEAVRQHGPTKEGSIVPMCKHSWKKSRVTQIVRGMSLSLDTLTRV